MKVEQIEIKEVLNIVSFDFTVCHYCVVKLAQ